MNQRVPPNTKRFITALIVGAVLGIVAGVLIRNRNSSTAVATVQGGNADSARASFSNEAPLSPESIESSAAWQYAVACRDGDWARVVALTAWMHERLALVEKSRGADSIPAERDRLMADLGTRTVADNHLADEGIEDPYVFSPGAEITYDSTDAGQEGLEVPVARRSWLLVQYPVREKALLDREGAPIRSFRVGVNVSSEGLILKGNVIGNLDIDWESIKYDWPLR